MDRQSANAFSPSATTSHSQNVNHDALQEHHTEPLSTSGDSSSVTQKRLPPPKLVVIGASAIDITSRVAQTASGPELRISQTTAPGNVSLTVGGVARNIAEAAHRLLSSPSSSTSGSDTMLLSPIGEDEFAPFLLDEMDRLGMRTDGMIKEKDGRRTAVCNMVLDSSGALVGGVADMEIVAKASESSVLQCLKSNMPSLVVLDANMSPNMLTAILNLCNQLGIATFFEPTSVTKSTAILPAILNQLTASKHVVDRSPVTFISPNIIELQHLYREADSETHGLLNHRFWWDVVNGFGLGSEWRMDLEQLARRPVCSSEDPKKGNLSFLLKDGIAQMAVNLLPFFQHVIVKCGDRGIVVVVRIPKADVEGRANSWISHRSNPHARCIVANVPHARDIVVLKHFPAIITKPEEIVSVTGAGDSLVGALSSAIVRDGETFRDSGKLDAAIQLSQEAAVASLHSIRAVSPLLGRNL